MSVCLLIVFFQVRYALLASSWLISPFLSSGVLSDLIISRPCGGCDTNTNTSSPKWNTYEVNFQLILRFNYHKLNLLTKTALTLTSVQEPYQTPIAKYRCHYNPASEVLQDFQVSHRVKNTQNESVNTIGWL